MASTVFTSVIKNKLKEAFARAANDEEIRIGSVPDYVIDNVARHIADAVDNAYHVISAVGNDGRDIKQGESVYDDRGNLWNVIGYSEGVNNLIVTEANIGKPDAFHKFNSYRFSHTKPKKKTVNDIADDIENVIGEINAHPYGECPYINIRVVERWLNELRKADELG